MKKGEKKHGSGHVSGMSPKSKDPACASAGYVSGPGIKKYPNKKVKSY